MPALRLAFVYTSIRTIDACKSRQRPGFTAVTTVLASSCSSAFFSIYNDVDAGTQSNPNQTEGNDGKRPFAQGSMTVNEQTSKDERVGQ